MGEVFGGRYELIDLIGEGGMGAVWRARDLKLNRIVAAKVLRQSDASALLRFVREQGLRVNHPNVIAPLGWIGEDNQVLFTMRIVAGGSLATLIGDHGALPPRFAAEILRQLLSGLQAVHSAHLVHRDVKPANILLDATGSGRPHAYLTDFGIAIDLAGPRFTETGMVHGTPGYLAPELMTLGDVTPAVDMFAAGQRTEKYLGVCIIGCHLDTGDTDHANARIFQLTIDQCRQLAANLFGHTFLARKSMRTVMTFMTVHLQRPRHFGYIEHFKLITRLIVGVILQRHPTFKAGADFLHVVFKAFERLQIAFPDHHVVA